MQKLNSLKVFSLIFLTVAGLLGYSQPKTAEYVPCQEMPNIIEQYNADFRVLSRFYSPAVSAGRGGGFGGGGGEAGVGSPEKEKSLISFIMIT